MLCATALAAGAASAHGEVFQLKGGGELVGERVAQPSGGRFIVRTSDGAEVAVNRADIDQMTQPAETSQEYVKRSRTAPDTVESHRQLAVWCKEHGLADEAAAHWQRVLEFEPDDEPARKSLGYARFGDRWLNRDQLMTARGLTMYDGKYRTPQDIAIRANDAKSASVEVDWFKQLRLWRDWLEGGRPEQFAQAQAQIAAIRDAAAAPAIIRIMHQESNPSIFVQLLDALGRLDHPEATQTLVALSLDDVPQETRLKCLDFLTQGGRSVSIVPYVQALGSADRRVVNRAGVALEKIADPAAISPLIDALVTRHTYQLQPGGNPGQMSVAFDPSGGGGGGLSMGGNGPKNVQRDRTNPEVHRALVKLAGSEDFGYDEPAWRRWFVDMQLHERINSRRDE